MPYFGNNPSPLLLNTVAQNGKEMTLDADADTSITADTDDQIDIKIGGSDIFQLTASKLDINGKELVLDADADTSITADTDDQIDIRIGGADDFQFTANTFTAQSGSTIAAQALTATTITASGVLDITDTTDASDATGDTGALKTEGGASIAKKLYVGTDLDVDGTANLDVVDIDGALTQDGGAVFNEDSADVDFRVESNGNTHRLFLDGGNDRILLGTTAARTMYGVTPALFQEGVDNETTSIGLVRNSNDGNGGFFIFGKSKGTSNGDNTVVATGNDLGAIVWTAADGTDMQSVAAMIVGGISSDVSPGANDVPGTLKFATANDGATGASHRMMIDQVGRIRIGIGELDHRLVTQQTTDVGTGAQVIATVGTFSTFGGHYFITGRNQDSSASRFCDQLTVGLNGSINVLHSTTVRASPHSRTYALSSENLTCAMGSANYTINVFAIDHITS